MNKLWFSDHHEADYFLLTQRSNQLITSFFAHSTDIEFKQQALENIQIYTPSSATDNSDIYDASLEILLKTRINRIHLKNAPVEAFLCTIPKKGSSVEQWQGLILVAALVHFHLFEKPSRLQDVLNIFRQIVADGRSGQVIAIERANKIEINLPQAWEPLDQIASKLSSYINQADTPQDVKSRLYPLRRIIEDIVENKLKNLRSSTSRESQRASGQILEPTTHSPIDIQSAVPVVEKVDNITTVVKKPRVDDSEAVYTEFGEFLGDASQSAVERIEFHADNAPTKTFVSVQTDVTAPASLRHSAMLSAMRAQTVASQIERREKRLTTSLSCLTGLEIAALKKALSQSEESKQIETLLLHLMLTTGRRLEQILQAKQLSRVSEYTGFGDAYIISEYGDWSWLYRPKLPQHTLDSNFSKVVDQQASTVVLSLPRLSEDQHRLQARLPAYSDELKTSLDSFVSDINRAHNTRLTVSRVADFLNFFLHQRGVDDVLIALIIGDPAVQPAGLYYQQYNNEHILQAYKTFTNTIFSASTSHLLADESDGKMLLGGSQLMVKEPVISLLFDHLKDSIKSKDGLVSFHNALTYYVLHLLNMTTGHRPVKHPFDDLNSIDLINGKIFISDKESRQTRSSARTLVLPEIAVKQIQLYITHLKAIKQTLHSLNPEVANFVDQAISAEAPFLFLLKENSSGDYGVQLITPKIVQAHVQSVFKLPLNWHRHFLRTFLANQQVNGEVIDSWMGHAKLGQEGYTRFSGLSIKDLQTVAQLIEDKLQSLKISAVSGWLG